MRDYIGMLLAHVYFELEYQRRSCSLVPEALMLCDSGPLIFVSGSGTYYHFQIEHGHHGVKRGHLDVGFARLQV